MQEIASGLSGQAAEHAPPRGWRRWVCSTNHKDIGTMYLVFSVVSGLFGGLRLGTAEIESALVAHPKVAEAAVVGFPHELKGQGIYAYVTLRAGEEPSEELRHELARWVRREIGGIAAPDVIQWAPALPKTCSGKIMRRILRKIAAGELEDLGDTSTLAEPGVVHDLVASRQAEPQAAE